MVVSEKREMRVIVFVVVLPPRPVSFVEVKIIAISLKEMRWEKKEVMMEKMMEKQETMEKKKMKKMMESKMKLKR